jgi:polyhydroxybutyrate depolymerase
LLAFALALLPSSALAAAGRVTLTSGGVLRTAILVQHRRLKQARRPAIVLLRGAKEKGGRLKRTFSLDEMARSTGAVLVYPEPLSGRWETSRGQEASRDAVFIRDLIARLIARGIAKQDKVFLVGAGTGGLLALRLACEEKDLFAGVAVIRASLPSALEVSCKPPRPVPFMMVADEADPVFPYQGGTASLPNGKVELLSAEATLGPFAKAAGCTDGVTATLLERDIHHGAHAYLDKLNNCAVPVQMVRIERGAHPPPGDSGTWHGFPFSEINSARLVWDFLRPLGG